MTRTLSTRPLAALAISIVVAAALLVLAGCGDDGADGGTEGGADTGSVETDSAALDGTAWRLVRWRETALDPADFTNTAIFADGTIGGTSAVNSYSGSYTTGPADRFSTEDLVATGMGGSGTAGQAEAAFMALLGDAASFHVTETTLTLFGSDGAESLIFTAGTGE